MTDELMQEFIDSWGQAVLLWQRLRRPILEKEQLTHTDKRILYGLYRMQQTTKKELAQCIVLEHSSLTRSLDRLVTRGLVTRITGKDDKRFVKLSLTQSGLTKTRSVKRQSLELAKHLFSGITAENIKQSSDVIKKFQNAMENMLETARKEGEA